ncbi:MAG: hypothetical protein V1913_07335 [Fibrobacterota bacterium]
MRVSYRNPAKALFKTASLQQGYFTAKQAIEAGYVVNNHSYHVQMGDWSREWRGIYRLNSYPISENGQYALWSLWSMNRAGIPQGVYSHETALSFFELSDIMPSKLHMTVPKTFRRHSKPPKILILHFGEFNHDEIEEGEGYRVAKPLRACLDLIISETVSSDIVRQALSQGKARGLITNSQVKAYLAGNVVADKIKSTLKEFF